MKCSLVKYRLLLAAFGIVLQFHPVTGLGAGPLPDAALVQNLSAYYPNLSCTALAAKSQFGGEGFKFLRTEIPWYWDQLKKDPTQLLTSSQQEKFRNFLGFCAGDAHPENFAIQTTSTGQPIFAINDRDDATENCPVLADFLRFLVAAKLSGRPVDATALTQTYLAALQAKPGSAEDSFIPADFLTSGLPAIQTEDDDAAPAPGDKTKGYCDEKQLASLTQVLASVLKVDAAKIKFKGQDKSHDSGNGKVKGCKTEIKTTGGSGGLIRYEVKYSVAGVEQPKMEFKSTQAAGPTFYTGQAAPTEQRYQLACQLEAQKSDCRLTKMGDLTFLLRVKDRNDRAVSLDPTKDQQGKEQLANILHNETVVLARLHRSNLTQGTAADYAQSLKSMEQNPKNSLAALASRVAQRAQEAAAHLKKISPSDFVNQCEASRSLLQIPSGTAPAAVSGAASGSGGSNARGVK